MNRSNVGNIATNAMQTLNIAGTTGAAMLRRYREQAEKRKKEDISTTLNAYTNGGSRTNQNAETYHTPEEVGNIFTDRNMPVKSKEPEVYNVEYTIRDKGAVLPENISPQSEALVRYVSNNLDWQKKRG